jgi:hypothetical protein
MASTAATTFWWGTAASAAPQHTRGTGHSAQQVGARCAGAGAAGDGAWHDDGGAQRGMERSTGWGSSAAPNGVRSREDSSSERMTQSSTRWGDIFKRRDEGRRE